MRCKNEGKYCSKEFDELYKHARIVRKITTPYTPQRNGIIERMKFTLMERDRSMLSSTKLDKCFWEEVVNTICY